MAIPDRLPPDPARPGHLIKARYTPLQACVPGADEQGSEYHDVLREADDLAGLPVVVADLHSALPAILAGYRADRAGIAPRIAYVMLDGGALPAWFSRSAAALSEAGWLTGTVTVGQAFGGDIEAVSLHSGLLAARHVLGAELAVVTQGPGNLGTGTRWGFSGVAAGEALNAVAVLSGRPVGLAADQRRRPARTAPWHLSPQPDLLRPGRTGQGRHRRARPGGEFGAQVLAAAQPLAVRHNLVRVSVAGLADVLADCPVQLSTMGRGPGAGPGLLPRRGGGRPPRGVPWPLDPAHSARATTSSDRASAWSCRTPPDGSCCSARNSRRAAASTGGSCPAAASSRARATSRPRCGSSPRRPASLVSPAQVGPPRWRRTSTWTARGVRRLQHEVVVAVRLDADQPPITDGGRTPEELEEYVEARWWDVADLLASSERFYPGLLPELLPAFLAGAELTEPFERWN